MVEYDASQGVHEHRGEGSRNYFYHGNEMIIKNEEHREEIYWIARRGIECGYGTSEYKAAEPLVQAIMDYDWRVFDPSGMRRWMQIQRN